MALRDFAKRTCAFVSGLSVVVLQVTPAYAQVALANPSLATVTTPDTNTTNILTTDISGGNGINRFTQFDVNNGKTVGLIQPTGTGALVNIIDSGVGSTVYGTLNLTKEGGGASNVYLVDPNGFVVGGTGTINAHTLTLSTASAGSTVESIVNNTAFLDDGDITIGPDATINAESVSFWTAGNLALNGTIKAHAPETAGTAVGGAVNTSHVQKATHATVQGGVIRFGAKNATIRGNLSARRKAPDPVVATDPKQHQGGQIRGEVTLTLNVEAGAVLSVDGVGYDAGSVVFNNFAQVDREVMIDPAAPGGVVILDTPAYDASVSIAETVIINATSDIGVGGFVYMAADTVNVSGDYNLGGSGALLLAGTDLLPGSIIKFKGDTKTRGGSVLAADSIVSFETGSSVDTTSVDLAGDITLISSDIRMDGATLTASSTMADMGGRIALIATERPTQTAISPVTNIDEVSKIDILDSALASGAIYIGSIAIAEKVVDDANVDAVENSYDAAEDDNGFFTTIIDEFATEITNFKAKGRKFIAERFPFAVDELIAEASIRITNSSLTADNNWSGALAPEAMQAATANNGFLGVAGIELSLTQFMDRNGLAVTGSVSKSYNSTTDAIYIQSHGETNVNINPISKAASFAVSDTSTNSSTIISGSTLTSTSGDVVLVSTVSENSNININLSSISKIPAAASLILAKKAINNQLIVTDGSINSGADLRAGAFSGKNYKSSNVVSSGTEGSFAIGVSVALGTSLTEAAIGGTIVAAKVDLDAETLYFNNEQKTVTTLGSNETLRQYTPANAARTLAVKKGAKTVTDAFSGGDGSSGDQSFIEKLAVGVSVDVQLVDDETYATLGGSYQGVGGAATSVGLTDVTASDVVTVDAVQRYATAAEAGSIIGPSLTRTVKAQMSSLEGLLDVLKTKVGADFIQDDTKDKDFGFFAAISVAKLGGAVKAEIGSSATINTASNVSVNALTQYQTTAGIFDFKGRFDRAMGRASWGDVNLATGDVTAPSLPELDSIIDPSIFLTSSVGTQSVQSAANGTDQKFALGVGVNLFETDNQTRAIISDSAKIINTSVVTKPNVTVTANQEAVFVHAAANSGGGLPIITSPSASAGKMVGANLSVPRMISVVEARVGDAELTDINDLTVAANTDVLQLTLAKAGGIDKASSFALNGAVVTAIVETTTLATVGAGAIISAKDILVEAIDDSRVVSIAGTGGLSTGATTASASGAINIIRRDTRASFGDNAAQTGGAVAANKLNVNAVNSGVVIAAAVAGSGSLTAPADPSNPASPSAPVPPSDSLNTDVGLVPEGDTAEISGKSLGLTGSLSLNLMLKNDARASVATKSTIALVEDANVMAKNSADDFGVSGAVSVGFGLAGGANMLAGAVAYKTDNRSVITQVSGATITARDVVLSAIDESRSVYAAIGGSASANAGFPLSSSNALAGSLSRIEEDGVTLVIVEDAALTARNALSFDARNANQLIAVAGAGSLAPLGGSIGVSSSLIQSTRDVRIAVSNVAAQAAQAQMVTLQQLKAYAISLSISVGKLGGGATVALNELSGSAIIDVQDLQLTTVNDTSLVSELRNDQRAYGGGFSVGTIGGIGAGSATNLNTGGARVILANSDVFARNIDLRAEADANLTSRGFGASFNTTFGLGLATAVNTSTMIVLTDIDGSNLYANENVVALSEATTTVNGLVASVAGSLVGAAATGSAVYNEVSNAVGTNVRGTSRASQIWAGGSVALLSKARTDGQLLGGKDGLPDANLNFTAGGAAAIGLSLTINTTNNQVATNVIDGAVIQGFGATAIDLGTRLGQNRKGVVIDAFAETDIDTLAASVAIAGKAAATAALTYNTLSDNAAVNIANGETVSINALPSLTAALADANGLAFLTRFAPAVVQIDADAEQSLRIGSYVNNQIDDYAVLIAGAAGGAVGAAGSGNLIRSQAITNINTAILQAQADIDLLADVDTTINTLSFGLAAGKGALSASVAYNSIKSNSLLALTGTQASSGGDLRAKSVTNNTTNSKSGNLAGGGGAGAGAVIVNVVNSTSDVRIASATALRPELLLNNTTVLTEQTIVSILNATNTLDIQAVNNIDVSSLAISGAGGGAAAAFSVAVSLIGAQTTVDISDNQILSGNDVIIKSTEDVGIGDNAGAVALGGIGIGGSVNFVNFTGGSKVFVGQNTRVTAQNNVSIDALSDRRIGSTVGVASIAAGSLNAVVSIVNFNGSSADPRGGSSATLARTGNALGEDQINRDSDATAGNDLLSTTGSGSAVTTSQTDRQSVDPVLALSDVPGTGLADIGVQIAAGAEIVAGNDVEINAIANASVDQTAGVLSASGASISASIGLVTASSEVDIIIGQNAKVEAANAVTISAITQTPNTIKSNVFAVGISASFGVGAGVSIVDLNTRTKIDVLDGAQITASGNNSNSGTVQIISERRDVADSEILSAGLSGLGALGVTYTKVRNTGSGSIVIGRADGAAVDIEAGTVNLSLVDNTSSTAKSIVAQGGGIAALSGSFSTAENSAQSNLILKRTKIRANTIATLDNVSAAQASANSFGLAAAGGGAIVASTATATLDAVVNTNLDAVSIVSGRILVTTEINGTAGDNASAFAESLTFAGGLAGSGATADAYTNYTVQTIIDGGVDTVVPTAIVSNSGSVLIRTSANDVSTRSVATGKTAAALAVGVVIANVGQYKDENNSDKGTVTTDVQSGLFRAYENLLIRSDNRQRMTVSATAGAGGIVAGSGGEANSYHNAVTETRIGTRGTLDPNNAGAITAPADIVVLIAGDLDTPDETRFNGRLTVVASQAVELDSSYDNRSASLLGVSGAKASSSFFSDVDLAIGGGVRATSNFAEISARNSAERLSSSPTIISESGGIADVAVLFSTVTGNFETDTLIDSGASLVQIGDPDLATSYLIETRSLYNIGDKLTIDAAGLVAAPFGDSRVTVNHRDAVTINKAFIRTAGDLTVSSGATAIVKATQISTSSGLAGVASAKARANYAGDSQININTGADIEGLRDIDLNAGYYGTSEQLVSVRAEGRVFNRTAIPISVDPTADAFSAVTSAVNVGEGSKVVSYQNVNLNATSGVRDIKGFGLAKDFYREILAGAAKVVGASLVLDTKTGSSVDINDSVVAINGEVRSGAYNRRTLYFDASNAVDNTKLQRASGNGFEDASSQPEAEFYQVIANSDEVAALQQNKNDIQARLDAGGLTIKTRERFEAIVESYNRRISRLGGAGSTAQLSRINIGYLRASEGSVVINSDRLTGSATGSVFAADEADIRIFAISGAVVNLTGLEITNVEGGEILFNDTLIGAGTSAYGFNVSFAENYGEADTGLVSDNTIQVSTTDLGASNTFSRGDIEISGRIVNPQGAIALTTAQGSIYAAGTIEGESILLDAPEGDVEIITPADGVSYAGPAPYITLKNRIEFDQAKSINNYNFAVALSRGANVTNFNRSTFVAETSRDTTPSDTASISAGGNVVIVAEYVNINGAIRAGTGKFEIGFYSGLQSTLDGFKNSARSDRIELQADKRSQLGFIADPDVYYTNQISNNTNATVFYNYATDQIEIDPIRVNGGAIYITSDVVSTGGGSLEAIDGLGSIILSSEITTDIVFGTVDLGSVSNTSGLIRIRDQSKPFTYTRPKIDPITNLAIIDASTGLAVTETVNDFATTEYRSLNGMLSIYDNRGGTYLDDPNIPGSERTPNFVVQGPTATGSATYNTTEDRDLVYVSQTSQLLRTARYKIELVRGNYAFGIDIPTSQNFRWTQIPTSVAINNNLGLIGNAFEIHDYAETPNGYSPVQASIGNYDYAYSFNRSNEQLRRSDIASDNSYEIDVYGGGTQRMTNIDSLDPRDNNLLSQYSVNSTSNVYFYENGVDRRAVQDDDINGYPVAGGLYPLVYAVDPSQRNREYYNNRLHVIVHKNEYLFNEITTHIHRIRADKTIDIKFSGGQGAVGSTLVSKGNIIFNRDVNAPLSSLSVESKDGSILTGNSYVSLAANGLTLSAVNGSIRGLEGSARINLTAGSALDAIAGNQIDIEEIQGNLVIARAQTTRRDGTPGAAKVGEIKLRATGDVLQTPISGSTVLPITASNLSMTSRNGSIGTAASPLTIIVDGGRFDASAQTEISVSAVSGDLGLGLVEAITGDVTLNVVAGGLLDRNSEEIEDIRTIQELEDLWGDELGLTTAAGVLRRQTAQIENYENRVLAHYQRYWADRGTASSLAFTLDAATEQALRGTDDPNGDIANARVADYKAELTALYAQWDMPDPLTGLPSQFSDTYRYTATTAQREAIADDLGWTLDELRLSVNRGVVIPASDTNTRDESPNIIAFGNININAASGVGEIKQGHVIAKAVNGATLSLADLAILTRALPGDLSLDAAGNTIVRQEEDLNFEFTNIVGGVSRADLNIATNASDVFIASEAATKVSSIDALGGDVELRINGNLTNAASVPVSILGGSILLESGVGSIGTALAPLTVGTAIGGTLQFASGGDAFVRSPTGGLTLISASANDALELTANGAITDFFTGGLDRVIADKITLNATSIGAADRLLGLRQTDVSGDVSLTSSVGDVFVTTGEALNLNAFNSAAGGLIQTGSTAALTLVAADAIQFGSTDTLALDLNSTFMSLATSGSDIAGGTLNLSTISDFGTQAMPITTQISTLNIAPGALAAADQLTRIYIANTGALNLASLALSTNMMTDTEIATTGDMTVGTATSAGRLLLTSGGDLEIANASAKRLELRAMGNIGAVAPIGVSADVLDVITQMGSARLALSGRDTLIERISALSETGAIDLAALSGRIEIGTPGISTLGGAQTLSFQDGVDVIAGGAVRSTGGMIDLTSAKDLALATGAVIETTSGAVNLTTVDGAALAQNAAVMSDNGAVTLDVGQGLSLAANAAIETVSGAVAVTTVGDVSLADAAVIKSGSAPVTLDIGQDLSLAANAAVQTVSGAVKARVGQDVTMIAGSIIQSDSGTIDLTVERDLLVTQIATGNATDQALTITGGGRVTVVDPAMDQFVANEQGALTRLVFNTPAIREEIRIRTNVAVLNAEIAGRALHIAERDTITLNELTNTDLIDVFAEGAVKVNSIQSDTQVVVSSDQSILANNATVSAPVANLFAFGGSISTDPAATFGLEISPDTKLNLYARDDVKLNFANGNGRLGYVIARDGDLTLESQNTGGQINADVLASGGTLSLKTQGDITIDYIGRGSLDLIDEDTLQLIERTPNPYGTIAFSGPQILDLTATAPTAVIDLGLVEVQSLVDLKAATIKANLYDFTPDDGLRVRLSGAVDRFANFIDVNVIADDDATAGILPVGRPDLSNRLGAKIRPEDATLPVSTGNVNFEYGRFDTGEFTSAGPELLVSDVIVSDQAILRNRLFDVLVETTFSELNDKVDAQILAVAQNGLAAGELGFRLFGASQMELRNLVVNRQDDTASVIKSNATRYEQSLSELFVRLGANRHSVYNHFGAGLSGDQNLWDYIGGFPVYLKDGPAEDTILNISKEEDLPLIIVSRN